MDGAKPKSLAQRLVGIGVHKSHAYMLANGERTPSLKLALEIERELGIPASTWPLPKPERAGASA